MTKLYFLAFKLKVEFLNSKYVLSILSFAMSETNCTLNIMLCKEVLKPCIVNAIVINGAAINIKSPNCPSIKYIWRAYAVVLPTKLNVNTEIIA